VLVIWKGASSKIKLSDGGVAGVILGVAFGVGLLVCVFFLPYLYRKLVVGDWQLKWYHIPLGPLLLRRGEIPPLPANHDGGVKDYYAGHLTAEQLEAKRAAESRGDIEHTGKEMAVSEANSDQISRDEPMAAATPAAPPVQTIVGPRPEGKWYSATVLFWFLKKGFFHGIDKDVVDSQKKKSILSRDLEAMHARASHFDNKAEYMYSFLQVLTAATASFSHGANDVSNAIGPFATIFQIWHEGTIGKNTPVPTWILAFGGTGIVIGLWLYGYNIMRNLGNRITLHSPSRGFSMELGSAVTIIMATRLSKSKHLHQVLHGALTYFNRASCLYDPMYHRCHRWCRSLLWRLADH
jgi:phosphate/sulfate permease